MSDFSVPSTFPGADFLAFGLAASAFFLPLKSEENLFDPQEKRRQFDLAWQAVRYRYRSCAECNDEFKGLLVNASDMWKAGWGDEELAYKLERCIYVFFTSALSVFDSFAFCLYFLGNGIQPRSFPDVSNPRNVNRKAASKAFDIAFPQAAITELLKGLPDDARFSIIDSVRNLVVHRLSGRRSVRAWSTTHQDVSHTHTREETWHIPGTAQPLVFDEELLQRQLDNIAGLLTPLASAARDFAETHQPAKVQP